MKPRVTRRAKSADEAPPLLLRPRLVLAMASVALVLAVVTTATALGPDSLRRWLVVSSALAVIASVQSVASDQMDLAAALLLALPPVIALNTVGSPTWLIGPLAVLLLLAGEMSALSWDCQGHPRMTASQRRRLRDIVPLGLLGLAGAVAVAAVPPRPVLGGTLAVGIAAFALAALGWHVFQVRETQRDPTHINQDFS